MNYRRVTTTYFQFFPFVTLGYFVEQVSQYTVIISPLNGKVSCKQILKTRGGGEFCIDPHNRHFWCSPFLFVDPDSICYHFPSDGRAPFGILSWSAGDESLICLLPPWLKDIFTGYQVVGWRPFLFQKRCHFMYLWLGLFPTRSLLSFQSLYLCT